MPSQLTVGGRRHKLITSSSFIDSDSDSEDDLEELGRRLGEKAAAAKKAKTMVKNREWDNYLKANSKKLTLTYTEEFD